MTKRIRKDEAKRHDEDPPHEDKRPKPDDKQSDDNVDKNEQNDKDEQNDKQSPPRHKWLSVVERRHPRIGSSYQVTALPSLSKTKESTKGTSKNN
jgi:hypothetical protein